MLSTMASTTSKNDAYHHGDLRSALLNAAVELAAEKGLQGLSLRECARRAGVSHAAPYRHFEDKNALLAAIAAEGSQRLADAGRAAMEGVTDPSERLDAYGVAYVRFALANPVHFRVMFTSECVEGDPPARVDDSGDASEAAEPDPNDAFGLLVKAAAEATGTEGEDALLAGFASWCVPHGLAMLLLDGRVPEERRSTPEQIDELARSVIGLWRAPRR